MMDMPMSFKSFKAFNSWLKNVERRAEISFYGRRLGREILIYTEPCLPGGDKFFPIELPAIAQARQWWLKCFEGMNMDYRIREDEPMDYYVYPIACIVKSANMPIGLSAAYGMLSALARIRHVASLRRYGVTTCGKSREIRGQTTHFH